MVLLILKYKHISKYDTSNRFLMRFYLAMMQQSSDFASVTKYKLPVLLGDYMVYMNRFLSHL